MHHRKAGRIGQVDLRQRDDVARYADRFKAEDLLGKQAGNSFQGGSLSPVEHPFLEDPCLQRGCPPQGQADFRMVRDGAFDTLVRNGTNEAVRQRSHRIIPLRQDVTVIVAEVTCIVKGEDLPPAIIHDSVATGDARQHHRQNLLCLAHHYDVVTAAHVARAREK